MAGTFEPIGSVTLTGASASLEVASIPSTYTDLRVVFSAKYDTTVNASIMRFNNDTGSNYAYTYVYSTGSGMGSSSSGSATYAMLDHNNGIGTSYFATFELDIFNYTSSLYKAMIEKTSSDENGSGVVSRSAYSWRNASAISSIKMTRLDGNNFAIGSSLTVWGIKNA